MKLEINQPFAADSAADEFDVRQMKKALNRLGYYTPYDKVGITGIPDTAVFNALKRFQVDQGLPATGRVKPDDETIKALSREAAKTPEGFYVWRMVEAARRYWKNLVGRRHSLLGANGMKNLVESCM